MSDVKRCRECHRPLPRNSGDIGPVCARRLTGPTSRRSRRPAPVPAAPDSLPGQDQIALFYFQATLEGI
jgi:hypothetical protein